MRQFTQEYSTSKKSDETDWRPDQSVVSRGYEVKWLTEEVLN